MELLDRQTATTDARDATVPATDARRPWAVSWSAVWVGALSAWAAALVFGLLATAVGAAAMKTISSWRTISRADFAISICATFLAFAIGGWVSGKISGARHAEPSILHAVIGWLVALPLILLTLVAGGGAALGGWYASILSSPLGGAATLAATSPDAVRNGSLAALTALLLGLVGAVIGGWIASGEPMTVTHHRNRVATW